MSGLVDPTTGEVIPASVVDRARLVLACRDHVAALKGDYEAFVRPMLEAIEAAKKAQDDAEAALISVAREANTFTLRMDGATLSIKRTPPVLVLDPTVTPKDVEAEFSKPVFDRTAIGNALRSGRALNWARLESGWTVALTGKK